MNDDVRPALRSTFDGLLLRVRVTPRASRDSVEGVEAGSDGVEHLKLKVRAVPDKGQANAALIQVLAKTLGLAKSDIEIASGLTSRIKTVRLAGADEKAVRARFGL